VTGDFSNNFECPFFFFGVDLLESSLENDNKDENHVGDQENDMTNNSKEEEERTVQNVPIENHDNSRNTDP
jgi:hypothetical protein